MSEDNLDSYVLEPLPERDSEVRSCFLRLPQLTDHGCRMTVILRRRILHGPHGRRRDRRQNLSPLYQRTLGLDVIHNWCDLLFLSSLPRSKSLSTLAGF